MMWVSHFINSKKLVLVRQQRVKCNCLHLKEYVTKKAGYKIQWKDDVFYVGKTLYS